METKNTPMVALTAIINEDNHLALMFRDVTEKLVPMRPGHGLEDLLALHGEAPAFSVEVTDFYQYGTIYDLYGATLAGDGHAVAAHWESTGRGRWFLFVRAAFKKIGMARFLIGATPRLPGAPVPAPFRSWPADGGSLPTDIDKPIGQ